MKFRFRCIACGDGRRTVFWSDEKRERLLARFIDKVTPCPITGCWWWTTAIGTHGYGLLSIHDEPHLAHRVSWTLFHGPIPSGFGFHGTCVLHRCDQRACVNPAHLTLGSQAQNLADMDKKGRRVTRTTIRIPDETVRAIRAACRDGESQTAVGRRFGVGADYVSRLVNLKFRRSVA